MKIVCFLTLTALSIAGCQGGINRRWTHQDLVVDANVSLRSPKKITNDQAVEDISFLIYALENGYGGKKYVPGNFYKIALKSLRDIRAGGDTVKFKDKVDRALLIIPDNHLSAKLNGKISKQRYKIYKKGTVGKNAISGKNKVWQVKLKRSAKKRYLYISITDFPSHKDKIWAGFLESVKYNKRKSKFIVLDLRGNGGGDDTFGLQLAELLSGGVARNPMATTYVTQTPETIVISANYYRIRKRRLVDKGEPVPGYFDEFIKERVDLLRLALQKKIPPSWIGDETSQRSKFNKTRGYSKPIYILMDGACGSSCESTIDYFEFHPFAKRVGENTGGFIHFGNIGYIILPNSKVLVQIASKFGEYFDKRFVERVGIAPDIIVKSGEDALEYVLKLEKK